MKRTPVLIDVNGVPLRESLSYNGGGAGFGGQMAEWLPPAQSADAALLCIPLISVCLSPGMRKSRWRGRMRTKC